MQCIPNWLIFTSGTTLAQQYAARTLWQLSSLADAKALIVQLDGIPFLVNCLARNKEIAHAANQPA